MCDMKSLPAFEARVWPSYWHKLVRSTYAFQVFTGFQWTGYFAGEIKNVRRTAITSIMGALVISAVLYILATLLVYTTYGFSTFGSLAYLGFNTPNSPLAFAPYLPSLVKFLALPGFLQVFVAACFVLSVLWWTPTGFLIATRNIFAWSFDRLAPARVAEVNDQLHTPVIATIVVALWVEILNYLNIYLGLSALLINVIARCYAPARASISAATQASNAGRLKEYHT